MGAVVAARIRMLLRGGRRSRRCRIRRARSAARDRPVRRPTAGRRLRLEGIERRRCRHCSCRNWPSSRRCREYCGNTARGHGRDGGFDVLGLEGFRCDRRLRDRIGDRGLRDSGAGRGGGDSSVCRFARERGALASGCARNGAPSRDAGLRPRPRRRHSGRSERSGPRRRWSRRRGAGVIATAVGATHCRRTGDLRCRGRLGRGRRIVGERSRHEQRRDRDRRRQRAADPAAPSHAAARDGTAICCVMRFALRWPAPRGRRNRPRQAPWACPRSASPHNCQRPRPGATARRGPAASARSAPRRRAVAPSNSAQSVSRSWVWRSSVDRRLEVIAWQLPRCRCPAGAAVRRRSLRAHGRCANARCRSGNPSSARFPRSSGRPPRAG